MSRYYEVPQTFKEWRRFSTYSKEDCARIFAVTMRTVNNWESGKIEPPRSVLICLQLFSSRLDFLGKEWKGFRITPECIESPDGDFVRAWEVRALRYAMQALDMRRDRPCRLNESRDGVVDSLSPLLAPSNVTFIDEARRNKPSISPVANSPLLVDDVLTL